MNILVIKTIQRCFITTFLLPHIPFFFKCAYQSKANKKLDRNYKEMLRAVLNKSWLQHFTKLLLHGLLPPISQTIQVKWTKHAGHSWKSKNKFISDVHLWTPTHGHTSVGRPARNCIHQVSVDTRCHLEDPPGMMDDKDGWRERESGNSGQSVRLDEDITSNIAM